MPDKRPVQGETWEYIDDDFPDGNVQYYVEAITELWVHLKDIGPYNRKEFEAGIEKGNWKYVQFSSQICPRCEERVKAEGDYLCWECRYGE
jgi:hypothetical protein